MLAALLIVSIALDRRQFPIQDKKHDAFQTTRELDCDLVDRVLELLFWTAAYNLASDLPITK